MCMRFSCALAACALLATAMVAQAQDNRYGEADYPSTSAANSFETPPIAGPRYPNMQPPAAGYMPANTQPAARPQGWPGAQQPYDPRPRSAAEVETSPTAPAVGSAVTTTPAPEPKDDGKPKSVTDLSLDGEQILARVGGDVILLGEVLPYANQVIKENKDKIPANYVDRVRWQLIRQRVEQLVPNKLIIADARRSIPAEGMENINEQLGKAFEEGEIPNMMERLEVSTRADLIKKLHEMGSSLAQQKRDFMERTMAAQWVRQKIDMDEEITHIEMLNYYKQNAEEFEFPAKARWEQLMVSYGGKRTRGEAYRELCRLGNLVQDGTTFADVAKQFSDGTTASKGGFHDWTTQGSLLYEDINKAIFTLPVGYLSPIIEDRNAFHVIRVLERREAGRTSFVEAQVDIRKRLREKSYQDQLKKYLEMVKSSYSVWTIFDQFKEAEEEAARQAATQERSPFN